MKSLGEAVKELREKRGWSQEELAARAGVKLQNIQQLEDGSVRTPYYLVKLAHAFGLNLEEIYRLTSAGQKALKGLPDDAARLARIIANAEPERYKAVELIAHAPLEKIRAILVLLGHSEEAIYQLPERDPSLDKLPPPEVGGHRSGVDRRRNVQKVDFERRSGVDRRGQEAHF